MKTPAPELKRLTAECEELRAAKARLEEELAEVQILLENTIEHSEAIDQQLSDRNTELDREKRKTDDLLLNILPAETAEELKRWGVSPARSYESVTVMFTDFHGFTQISQQLTPQRLVSELDLCFRAFDDITSRHGLEKIKTIGDSYLCVGGMPKANATHPRDAITAALEMQKYVGVLGAEKMKNGEAFFEMRVGIHTGPVVAGIVGHRKFAYDLWGDTVNTASRLESSGEVGKVNISGATWEQVKNYFDCHFRGKVAAKNKGEIDMYFVLGEMTRRSSGSGSSPRRARRGSSGAAPG